MQQVHLRLFDSSTTFAMITVRAGSNQVCPHMFTPQMAWNDMVHGKIRDMLTAVLAGVIIPTQHFSLGQLHLRAWSMDHLFQTNDGRARINLPHCLNLAPSIQDQAGFSINDEGYCAARIADVNRLEIRVKHQNWGLHDCLQFREL
jgi:hypothetical protein